MRGQSPPPLYHAKNETPAWINDRNREAKYIDEDDQIKARRYSHSHHSGTAFDGTEEENKRPIHHYSPTKSSNHTELETAGRQLVSYGPRVSPPLPRKYYHSGRINDKVKASAPRFNVPNKRQIYWTRCVSWPRSTKHPIKGHPEGQINYTRPPSWSAAARPTAFSRDEQ